MIISFLIIYCTFILFYYNYYSLAGIDLRVDTTIDGTLGMTVTSLTTTTTINMTDREEEEEVEVEGDSKTTITKVMETMATSKTNAIEELTATTIKARKATGTLVEVATDKT